MDKHSQGMDPKVKHYFRKILNSLSFGLLWLLSFVSGGLFFNLLVAERGMQWYNWLFYAIGLITFVALLRYFYRTWKSDADSTQEL